MIEKTSSVINYVQDNHNLPLDNSSYAPSSDLGKYESQTNIIFYDGHEQCYFKRGKFDSDNKGQRIYISDDLNDACYNG